MAAIDINILLSNGATVKKYSKGEIIFYEDGLPKYYYQIVSGAVKVYSTSSEGKEFIQGFFKSGESFGEPPLFLNYTYPSFAKAIEDCEIIKMGKESFFNLLNSTPSLVIQFLKIFAERIYNKATNSQILLSQTPEEKILLFLTKYKNKHTTTNNDKQIVPFTRQLMADMTGLRVETVIRTIKKLHENKKLEIINHKIYY